MRNHLSIIAVVLAIACCHITSARAEVHKVSTWQELTTAVQNYPADEIHLTADIDLGNQSTAALFYNVKHRPFKGKIIGNKHTISNGRFSTALINVTENAVFKEINFENISVDFGKTRGYAGGFLIYEADNTKFEDLTFKNCSLRGDSIEAAALLIAFANSCQANHIQLEECNVTGKGNTGLIFGYGNIGTISNSNAVRCRISSSGENVGGIIGYCGNGGGIDHCTITGKVHMTANEYYCGGIVGFINGWISGCINYAEVESKNDYVGGIAGRAEGKSFTILGCKNTGYIHHTSLSGFDDFMGGIVGKTDTNLKYCTNTGRVDAGDSRVGGIVGEAQGDIYHCLNAGAVDGDDNVGGIVGRFIPKMEFYRNCYVYYKNFMYNCLNVGSYDGTFWRLGPIAGNVVSESGVQSEVHRCYYLQEGATADWKNEEGSAVSWDDLHAGRVGFTLKFLDFNNVAWGQNMNNDGSYIDPYPTPDGPVLFWHGKDCVGREGVFYNNNAHEHTGEITATPEGFYCSRCRQSLSIGSIVPTVFEIRNFADLKKFASYIDAHPTISAQLCCDIDCGGASFEPMGSEAKPFRGTFDGQGFRIRNLHIEVSNKPAGLFAFVGSDAVICNLIMDASSSVSQQSTNVAGAAAFAGRIVDTGTNSTCNVTFQNCGNEADITGDLNVAGIVGVVFSDLANVKIINCYNTGDIKGRRESAAMCGWINKEFTIQNCWSSGQLYGTVEGQQFYRCSASGTHTVENNFIVGDDQTGVRSTNDILLASGYVCYYLNGGTDGSAAGGWYQNLTGQKDEHPVLEASDLHKLYRHKRDFCHNNGWTIVYTNSEEDPGSIHTFDANGFCTAKSGEIHYEVPDLSNKSYQISNAGNLYWYAQNFNAGLTTANAVLTKDIVVNDLFLDDGSLRTDLTNARIWTPIGTAERPYHAYFSGANHTIKGLYMPQSEDASHAGLFGIAFQDASISDLGVIDSYFYGREYAGAVVAMGADPEDGTNTTGAMLYNCYSTGVVCGSDYVGGIAGYLIQGSERYYHDRVTGLFSLATVSSKSDVYSKTGALFGYLHGADNSSYQGTLLRCFYQEGKNLNGRANSGKDYGTKKSALAFQLGEVCSALNSGDEVWTQRIGTDAYPTFGTGNPKYVREISSQWGTLLMPFALTSDSNIQYYAIERFGSDYTLLLKAVESVEPNVPCFFKVPEGIDKIEVSDASANASAPASEMVSMTSGSPSVTLIGAYQQKTIPAGDNYYLAQNQLWSAEAPFTLPAYRAYFNYNAAATTSCPATIRIVVSEEGQTTQIGEIRDGKPHFYDGKFLENGRIVIRKDGKTYDAQGHLLNF